MSTELVTVVLLKADARQTAALVRRLHRAGGIQVLETAHAGADGVRAIELHRPQVVVCDLGLADAQDAVETIMADAPTPILALADVAADPSGSDAIRALAAGAVDALPKPAAWDDASVAEIGRAIRRVSRVPVIRRRRPRARFELPARRTQRCPVVAMAASTGGPQALSGMLRALGPLGAPVLIVQHIHESFAPGFAAWLSGASGQRVALAVAGEAAEPGRVYVAPGERHLRLVADRRLDLAEEPRSLHRPSADVLFSSVAEAVGADAIGVLLTGMGEDGASGLLAIRRAGGRTFAQDEATSAVFGMPRAAARAGAVERALPLSEIPAAIRAAVEGRA